MNAVTRIALMVGVAVVLAVLLAWILALPMVNPRQWLPWVLLVGGMLAILFGVGWLLRVTRGPEEKPASWRYRDR